MFVQTKGIDLILNISSPIGTEDIGTLSLSPPLSPILFLFHTHWNWNNGEGKKNERDIATKTIYWK